MRISSNSVKYYALCNCSICSLCSVGKSPQWCFVFILMKLQLLKKIWQCFFKWCVCVCEYNFSILFALILSLFLEVFKVLFLKKYHTRIWTKCVFEITQKMCNYIASMISVSDSSRCDALMLGLLLRGRRITIEEMEWWGQTKVVTSSLTINLSVITFSYNMTGDCSNHINISFIQSFISCSVKTVIQFVKSPDIFHIGFHEFQPSLDICNLHVMIITKVYTMTAALEVFRLGFVLWYESL